MSKHTPGKWRIKAELNVENENYDFVATCGCNGRDIEINKANAQLISAAPDLLEVCKRAMQSNIDGSYVSGAKWWEKMKQAIAKAQEGGFK